VTGSLEAQLTVGNSRQVLVHERNETIEGAWHAISQLTERLGDRVLCDRSQFLPPARGGPHAGKGMPLSTRGQSWRKTLSASFRSPESFSGSRGRRDRKHVREFVHEQ